MNDTKPIESFPNWVTLLYRRKLLKGYALMMNDQRRNQFYENILRGEVSGKTVIEAGFGTGLLTFLAFQAGAKRVIAYEERPDTYALAKRILEGTAMAESVTLRHETFRGVTEDADCLIHENLGQLIWDEHLYSCIRKLSIPIYPSEYFANIYFREIEESWVANLAPHLRLSIEERLPMLQDTPIHFTEEPFVFSPGIPMDRRFIQIAQKLMRSVIGDSRDPGTRHCPVDQDLREVLKNEKHAAYRLNANERSLAIRHSDSTKTQDAITEIPRIVSIPLFTAREATRLCVSLEFGVAHRHHELVLTEDYEGKSWDLARPEQMNRLFAVPKGQTLHFTQSLTDGSFHFHY